MQWKFICAFGLTTPVFSSMFDVHPMKMKMNSNLFVYAYKYFIKSISIDMTHWLVLFFCHKTWLYLIILFILENVAGCAKITGWIRSIKRVLKVQEESVTESNTYKYNALFYFIKYFIRITMKVYLYIDKVS